MRPAVSYTIDQQRDKDMGRSGGLVFSFDSTRRRVSLLIYTFRGIGAFRFVKVQIRAAAPTRISGYRNVLNDAWSNRSSLHRMFGSNTLCACPRCIDNFFSHLSTTTLFLKSLGPRERDDIDRRTIWPRALRAFSFIINLSRLFLVSPFSGQIFSISGHVGSTVNDLARGT